MLVDQRTLDTSTLIHPFRAVEELVALLHRAPALSSDNVFPGIAQSLPATGGLHTGIRRG